MTPTAIFWPMIAHVLLVYLAYGVLARRRYGAIRAGTAKMGEFKVRATEPEDSVTAANNVSNQLELPMLFHIGCLSLFLTGGVSLVTLVLAWVFVASRYAHAYVHMTSNRVRVRARTFQIGVLMVGVMWVWLALHLSDLI